MLSNESQSNDQQEQEEDFLSGYSPQEAPNACSLDNPDCEACQ